MASRHNSEGKYVATQGGFIRVEIGEVVVGGDMWTISVCKDRNIGDPGDSDGEVLAAVEEYTTWVKAGFDPLLVTDEGIMESFLETHAGQEWTERQR